MDIIELFDYPLFFFYGLILFVFTKKILKKNSTKQEYKWFINAWFIKMAACLAYAWMIVYYYGYGDSLTYHGLGDILRSSILDDLYNISFFFRDAGEFAHVAPYYAKGADLSRALGYYNDSNFIIHRLSCFISFFTFNRFLLISFVFANFGFWGSIIIYKALKKIFTNSSFQIALAALFIPSCIFWSSGLAKEPLCILCEAVILYYVADYLMRKKISRRGIFLTLLSSYILFTVKAYIFVSLAAGIVVWLLYNFIQKSFSKQPIVKFAFFLLLIIASAFPAFILWSSIQTIISENIGETIASYSDVYTNIYRAEAGGSIIQVESFDYKDPAQVLAFLPKALVNVIFRPWPWEISNPLMVLTVLENIFFTYLFIKTLVFTKFFTRNSRLNGNFQLFVLIFTLLLALIIGVSTFNFGTLVRYRIPFLPFWVFFLLLKSKKQVLQTKVPA